MTGVPVWLTWADLQSLPPSPATTALIRKFRAHRDEMFTAKARHRYRHTHTAPERWVIDELAAAQTHLDQAQADDARKPPHRWLSAAAGEVA